VKRWHPMYDTFKRVADILVAGLLLVVLSPLLLVLAILVRLYLGSPVLFAQMRPGKGGELFRMLKFRTMIPAPAATGAVEAVGSDDPESPGGRRSTAETRSTGMSVSQWMCGTWITGRLRWMPRSSA